MSGVGVQNIWCDCTGTLSRGGISVDFSDDLTIVLDSNPTICPQLPSPPQGDGWVVIATLFVACASVCWQVVASASCKKGFLVIFRSNVLWVLDCLLP